MGASWGSFFLTTVSDAGLLAGAPLAVWPVPVALVPGRSHPWFGVFPVPPSVSADPAPLISRLPPRPRLGDNEARTFGECTDKSTGRYGALTPGRP